MGLDHTVATTTSKIPAPVLHSFSSERRVLLGIPPNLFYEEATFWNTQWGTPIGANQTTTIDDMITTAVKVGTGELLSKKSYEAMTASNLLGFGQKLPVCEPPASPRSSLQLRPRGRAVRARGSCRTRCWAATARRRRTCPPRRSPSRRS